MHGLHHHHQRKRQGKVPPVCEKGDYRCLFDKLVYIAGIIGPIVTIPQIYNIWVDKNAAGVSVITWFGYLIAAIMLFGYGIVHKEKPLILIYGCYTILDILIVVGTLMYG